MYSHFLVDRLFYLINNNYIILLKVLSNSLKRLFTITDPKPIYAEWLVSIDLTRWLGTEEIDSVTYTAKDIKTNKTVTSTVLDTTKCTNTATVVKPFIQSGTSGATYIVKMQVTTDSSPVSKDEFYLKFSIDNNIPRIGE